MFTQNFSPEISDRKYFFHYIINLVSHLLSPTLYFFVKCSPCSRSVSSFFFPPSQISFSLSASVLLRLSLLASSIPFLCSSRYTFLYHLPACDTLLLPYIVQTFSFLPSQIWPYVKRQICWRKWLRARMFEIHCGKCIALLRNINWSILFITDSIVSNSHSFQLLYQEKPCTVLLQLSL